MPPTVTELVVKNYRSFASEVISFVNPTFLVGHNGAGKSNLAEVFDFVSEAMGSPLQSVFAQYGGVGRIYTLYGLQSSPRQIVVSLKMASISEQVAHARYTFAIGITSGYGFDVVREQCDVRFSNGERAWFDRQAGEFLSNLSGLAPAIGSTALVLPVIGGDKRFAPVLHFLSNMRTYAIEPVKLRGQQHPWSGNGLKSDGSNAGGILLELKRNHPVALVRMQEYLRASLPHVNAVLADQIGDEVSMLFAQRWDTERLVSLSSEFMSDGTLRMLGLLLAVFQPSPPSVLILEEPEATVHPGALGGVADLIQHASRNMQVIVTTHSPELLDAASWLGGEHLRVVTWDKGISHVVNVAEPVKENIQRHLLSVGEMMRSDALEPVEPSTESIDQNDLFETFA